MSSPLMESTATDTGGTAGPKALFSLYIVNTSRCSVCSPG